MDISESKKRIERILASAMKCWDTSRNELIDDDGITNLVRQLHNYQEDVLKIATEAYDELSEAVGGFGDFADVDEKKIERLFVKRPLTKETANILKVSMILIEVLSNLIKATRCLDGFDASRSSDTSDFLKVVGEMQEIVTTYGLDKED